MHQGVITAQGRPRFCHFSGSLQNRNQQSIGSNYRLMQIHLPIHQSPGNQKFLYAINALFFHHQIAILHIQHMYQSIHAHNPLTHPGIKTVAHQIIQPIHIQLTGNQLMQKRFLVIIALKNIDRQTQSTAKLDIHPLHQHDRNILVIYPLSQSIF